MNEGEEVNVRGSRTDLASTRPRRPHMLQTLTGRIGGVAATTALLAGGAHLALPASSAVAGSPAPALAGSTSRPHAGTQFVRNAGFAAGLDHWQGTGRLAVRRIGLHGSRAARLTSGRIRTVSLTTRPRAVVSTDVGSTFRAGAWMRTSRP